RRVSCLGQCDRAPAGSINDVIVPGLTPARLTDLVGAAAAGAALPHMESTPASTPLGIHPYAAGVHYAALHGLLASRDIEGVLTILKASELRGLGGAGFPTGVKWEIVRAAPGPEKYVVCNADESEPGTIKDRFLMEHAPHLVLEGMILAGMVTGARTGIIYIRHEYEAQAAVLQREIDDCRRRGLLGAGARGGRVPFDVTLFDSPGGYEIAMGTGAREVIVERAGGVLDGRALKAFAPSGASSGYLPASMVDVPLDFKSLQQAGSMLGSGAIVVCADGTCMLD